MPILTIKQMQNVPDCIKVGALGHLLASSQQTDQGNGTGLALNSARHLLGLGQPDALQKGDKKTSLYSLKQIPVGVRSSALLFQCHVVVRKVDESLLELVCLVVLQTSQQQHQHMLHVVAEDAPILFDPKYARFSSLQRE